MTSIIFFFIFVPILSAILLSVNFIFAPHKPYKEKKTPFECGYHSFLSQNRTQFTISFFIFALLFLIFDLEIVLIYPYSVSSYTNDVYGLIVMIIFTLVLTVGFIFELGKNALKIDSKQAKNFASGYDSEKNNNGLGSSSKDNISKNLLPKISGFLTKKDVKDFFHDFKGRFPKISEFFHEFKGKLSIKNRNNSIKMSQDLHTRLKNETRGDEVLARSRSYENISVKKNSDNEAGVYTPEPLMDDSKLNETTQVDLHEPSITPKVLNRKKFNPTLDSIQDDENSDCD